jgi:hypothetical protein
MMKFLKINMHEKTTHKEQQWGGTATYVKRVIPCTKPLYTSCNLFPGDEIEALSELLEGRLKKNSHA